MSIKTNTGEDPRTAIKESSIENSDGWAFYQWGTDDYDTAVESIDPTADPALKPDGCYTETILFIEMSSGAILTSHNPYEIVCQMPGEFQRVFYELPELGQQMNGASA